MTILLTILEVLVAVNGALWIRGWVIKWHHNKVLRDELAWFSQWYSETHGV